jgi:hypothetical protein
MDHFLICAFIILALIFTYSHKLRLTSRILTLVLTAFFSYPSAAVAELTFDLGNCQISGEATIPITALGGEVISGNNFKQLSQYMGNIEDIFEGLIGRAPDQEFDYHGYNEGGFLYYNIVFVGPASIGSNEISASIQPYIRKTTNPNLSSVRSLSFIKATLGQSFYTASKDEFVNANGESITKVKVVLCGRYLSEINFNNTKQSVEGDVIYIYTSPNSLPESVRTPQIPEVAPLERNTSCDHVYVGQHFDGKERLAGLITIGVSYEVLGFSARSEQVTVRSLNGGNTYTIKCSQVTP